MIQRFAVLLSALTVLAAATPALAQDDDVKKRARAEFERGVERFDAEDFEGALEAFQEAYRLKPHPNVRLNMANCYEELGRPVEALFHYERFLDEADDAPAGRRREVKQSIEDLGSEVGKLELQIAPDGATVVIDDAETRRAPIHDVLRLDAGAHSIEVSADGYAPQTQDVEVAGGDTETVSIRLERGSAAEAAEGVDEPEPAAEDAADEQADAGDEADDAELATSTADIDTDSGGGWRLRFTAPVLISAGATVAMGAVWLGTGIAALGAESDFDSAVERSMASGLSDAEREEIRKSGRQSADKADRLARTSDAFMALTLAGAAATTFFVITEGMADDPAESAESESRRWTATPAVGSEGGGVVVHGQF